ncbi:Mu transposase C-terminal domain-containing protein [Ornithobacterium rhinotracheale]|uniref:Mu transposase C-terminal domain-containing protein n=1 Tax=Ornithobacterium rhinotracheale TaxID=28251 RepID=UPI001FF1D8A9|nr:Mu transposase C-terminal domain-containing protein [Ornithobacterium rhinotracheale]MCK0206184.1 Mu transposase C-terminal domain-containing protein [Ornithobacterium rhinotracheale]
MFEYYENILCVEAKWLYDVANIMSKSNYKWLCSKGKMQKVTIGGNGRKAMVAYDSIPERFKKAIRSVVNGDPYEKAKHIFFADYIKPDFKAETFYKEYELNDGSSLPAERQVEYYHSAMMLNTCHEIITNVITCKKFGGKMRAWAKMADAIQNLPTQYKHKLPANPRRLRQRYRDYKTNGYEVLIHSNYLNTNAEKLSGDAAKWTLARWANQVDVCANLAQLHAEYNALAERKGWKEIREEKTFYNFLYSPEIEPLWYGHRHGELAAKERYGYQLKTKMPVFRDSLWFSDGTKLNYYYLDENGNISTCQVYEVMDAFSEVLLGYHISKSEDFEAQYSAYKMAIQISGYRPYQIKYDNQGGHKKLQNGDFLAKIAKIQTATQPYNGKSKTIESAFGRLQSQFLKRDWFFTGQNITAKKQSSKANMEFILANKSSLPSLDEVKAVYEKRRKEWNSAPHHKTGKPRIEMYFESTNPDTKAVEIWDMVEMFWVTREKPITVSAAGVSFIEKKVKYDYMVYTDDNQPDLEWLGKSIGKKLVVKFDPEDMSEIRLFEDTPLGLRFVAVAKTKIEVGRAIQQQDDWEQGYIRKVIKDNKTIRQARRDTMEEILAEWGMTAEQQGLVKAPLKGIERNKVGRKKGAEIGEYTKKISNQDWDEDLELQPVNNIDISKFL